MSAILSLDLGVKIAVHRFDKKTTTFDIMDDPPPSEKIEEKRVDMTKPVGPIMGRGMLWGREKRKEEPLKNSEGPAAKRARMMVSRLSEAKTMAKKNSSNFPTCWAPLTIPTLWWVLVKCINTTLKLY